MFILLLFFPPYINITFFVQLVYIIISVFKKYRYYLSNKVAPVAWFKKKKLRMVIVNTSLVLTRTSDTQGSRAFYIIFIPHNHLQFTD